jgi:hypothetical protein
MEQEEETSLPQKRLFTQADTRLLLFSCGALIAVDFLFIQGYVSLAGLDTFEQTAMDCFAAAIPFLVVYAFAANLLIVERKSPWIRLGVILLFVLVVMVNLYGLLNAFWHFSSGIGAIFFCSSFFALLLAGKIFFPPSKRGPSQQGKNTIPLRNGNESGLISKSTERREL